MTVMSDISITAKVKDTSGTLVLDLSAANGYQLMAGVMADRVWRRVTVESPDVRDDVELQSVLAAGRWAQPLRVVGITTAQVEARCAALIDAVSARSWLWEVTIDGHARTYRARRADTTTGLETNDLVHHKRPMTLTIPVSSLTLEEE